MTAVTAIPCHERVTRGAPMSRGVTPDGAQIDRAGHWSALVSTPTLSGVPVRPHRPVDDQPPPAGSHARPSAELVMTGSANVTTAETTAAN
jgi:hypothetical protein